MEIKTKTQLLEFIRKESLKFLKENQAFSSMEDIEKKLSNIEKHFIEVSEKDYEKLKNEEKSAKEFNEFQSIKQQKIETLKKMINAYTKKIEYMSEIKSILENELNSGIVKDKELDEFKNEDIQKGSIITLQTLSSNFELKKSSENNQYTVLKSDIEGINPGDIVSLPNMNVGSSSQIQVYKKVGDKFITSKPTEIQRITKISKRL